MLNNLRISLFRSSELMADRGLALCFTGSDIFIPALPLCKCNAEDLPPLNEESLKRNREVSHIDANPIDSTSIDPSTTTNDTSEKTTDYTSDDTSNSIDDIDPLLLKQIAQHWPTICKSFSKHKDDIETYCEQKRDKFIKLIQEAIQDLFNYLHSEEKSGNKSNARDRQSKNCRDFIKKITKKIRKVFGDQTNYRSGIKERYIDALTQSFLSYAYLFKICIPSELHLDPNKEVRFIKDFSQFVSLIITKNQLKIFLLECDDQVSCKDMNINSSIKDMNYLYNLANIPGLPIYCKLLCYNNVAKKIYLSYDSFITDELKRESIIFYKQCDEKNGKALKCANQVSLTFLQKTDEIFNYILSYSEEN